MVHSAIGLLDSEVETVPTVLNLHGDIRRGKTSLFFSRPRRTKPSTKISASMQRGLAMTRIDGGLRRDLTILAAHPINLL